jgi:glucose/arabinose dehydrogenase
VVSRTPLVVDDRGSENPGLVPVSVSGSAAQHAISLPPGFSISIIATGLSYPRFMAFDPAGNLIVGSLDDSVYRVAINSGAAAVQQPETLLRGLTAPHSVAFNDGYLYVAETGSVKRYPYASDGTLGAPEVVISDLPLVGEHFTRTVDFGPDGKMYVGVGSSCNICDEQDPHRAAISQYNADGSGYDRFAWGTRNPVGLAFQPSTGALWATVNERDYQGNEIPPDLVTLVQQNDNFGWPDCQPPNATPQDPGDDCSGVTPPSVGIQAHSAPLGLAFYTGSQFPSDYQGDLFVAEHGSWNRQPPAPPQIVRVHFQNGQPVSVSDFATGWQTSSSGARWGRPAGIIVAPDGSLIVSDDQSGVLYRISYNGS